MGDSGKGFKSECWRACSSLRFSLLELCPAMDHRLGALGLLGSSGGFYSVVKTVTLIFGTLWGFQEGVFLPQTHQCSSTLIGPSGGDAVY